MTPYANAKPLNADDDFVNEKGVAGCADAFFSVEGGRCVAILVARVSWSTPKGHARSQMRTRRFAADDPDGLAVEMTLEGFEAPANLAHLCGWPPRRRVRRAGGAS